ncbi:MAG: lactate/malate family dehydrogenase [Anaerolineae bacterium]
MRIGAVGTSPGGATAAYALVMRGIGREIILVDKNETRAQAEADDILYAVSFAYALQGRQGSYRDLVGSQIVILSAGVNQQPERHVPGCLRRAKG